MSSPAAAWSVSDVEDVADAAREAGHNARGIEFVAFTHRHCEGRAARNCSEISGIDGKVPEIALLCYM